MKAHIHKETDADIEKVQPGQSASFHGHEIQLTIAMIVRNEEKKLNRCLSSLKPLMEAVSSELIITDTGSTDHTVEIAQKYTDRILHFQWCSDFSAARNTGVSIARGEWLLVLDADEWLADAAPVIHFFRSGECDRCNSAVMTVRNYSNAENTEYDDSYSNRLIKTFPGMHYSNAVHESIPIKMPLNMIDAVLNHDGYVYHSKEEREQHEGRDMKLMKQELQKNPDDIKALLQYSLRLVQSNPAKAAEYARKGAKAVLKTKSSDLTHNFTRMECILLQALCSEKHFKELLDEIPHAISQEKKPCLFHLEFYYLAQYAAFSLQKYETAVEYGKKYLQMYSLYEEGKMDRCFFILANFQFIGPKYKEYSSIFNCRAYLQLGKTKEVKNFLEKIDPSVETGADSDDWDLFTEYAEKTNDWALFVRYYGRVLALKKKKRLENFCSYTESYYQHHYSQQAALLRAFSEFGGEDEFSVMYRGRLEELENDSRFHGHEVRLTVTMIVKNEEKKLDRCLSSLKPLMDAVPSELIVTDTGSTDHTVEIAKKYTEHILHFKWCNDFAAARNVGISAAHGEWLLIIDADEWFDDTAPLVKFFNSGECDSYNSGQLVVQNYTSLNENKYDISYSYRLMRVYPGVRYYNTVHEDLPINQPVKSLDLILNHDGYVYFSQEDRERHEGRNSALIKKELQKDPDDIKALSQYCAQFLNTDMQKTERYARHGVEVALRQDPDDASGNVLRMENILLKVLNNEKKYRDVLLEVPKALLHMKQPCVFHLEFYYIAQIAAVQLQDYKKTLEYGKKYLQMYSLYEAGKMDRSQLMYADFRFNRPEYARIAAISNNKALLALGKTSEVRDFLNQLNVADENATENGDFDLCTEYANAVNNWQVLTRYYEKLLALNDGQKLKNFFNCIDAYCANYPSRRENILRVFAERNGDDNYTLTCRLQFAEYENDLKKADLILDTMRKKDSLWNGYESEAFYYILKRKVNLIPYLSHIDLDDISLFAMRMDTQHDNFSEIIKDYAAAYSFENPKALFCMSLLLERAVLRKNAEKNEGQYGRLILAYFQNLAHYVYCIYKPDILSPAGISALPRVYRFGYYAGEALRAKQQGDGVHYLESLRAGLKVYPVMEEPITFLLKRLEEKQEKQAARAKEFEELARQAKKNIECFIAQGDLKQAGAYTLQLAKLIPEDDDLRRFRRLTHTEPTMEEIASRLPQ